MIPSKLVFLSMCLLFFGSAAGSNKFIGNYSTGGQFLQSSNGIEVQTDSFIVLEVNRDFLQSNLKSAKQGDIQPLSTAGKRTIGSFMQFLMEKGMAGQKRGPAFLKALPSQQEPEFNSTSDSEKSSVRNYTPARLLPKGTWEINHFSRLYTQKSYFDDTGEKVPLLERITYYTAINSIQYGVSRGLNAGLEVYFKRVRINGPSASPLEVFRFSSPSQTRTAFTSVAPGLKFSPFKSIPEFGWQTAVVIPVGSGLEGDEDTPFQDYRAYQWWNQLFFDLAFNNQYLIFLESNFYLRFGSGDRRFFTPLKAQLTDYISSRWTAYLQVEFAPTWGDNFWSAYYSQTGLGLKYLLFPNFEMEGLFTLFPYGLNTGAGATYNLGFRWLF
ncbi:MAG: hypothetical protein WAN36_11295 [Calditrichia bacterium]